MRKTILILSICFAFNSSPALAHGNESHGHAGTLESVEDAFRAAQHIIVQGIMRQMLPESWENATPISAEVKMGEEIREWVIVLSNESIEKSAEQTLYIFLSLGGSYIRANFTGE